MSTIDQTLLSALQYQVIEPPDGGAVWPSGLWTRDEVIALANQRQDRLLKHTLLIVVTSTPIAVAISQHRVALPADWIRTVSVVWTGNDGTISELGRADSFEADHLLSTWDLTNASAPEVYMEIDSPSTLEVQIAPAPSVAGTLTYLYIPMATDLTGNGETIDVPDEFESVLRYGTLADMLSKDGRGRDPGRAAYAEQRFQLGIEAARLILAGWS